METVTDLIFLGSKITANSDCSHEIKRCLLLGRKAMTNLDSILKHLFADKGPSSRGYAFSSSHVQMWELDHKEGWALKDRCFLTVVLEKTLESPLDSKGMQPVHPKGNQSWIFIRRTDAEAEAPIFGHLMQRADSLEKTTMLGKTEGRRRRGQQRMMLMFTLAISYLTTSSLPWLMNLTFQVPTQYCSLQHRALLLSPVISSTGHSSP